MKKNSKNFIYYVWINIEINKKYEYVNWEGNATGQILLSLIVKKLR